MPTSSRKQVSIYTDGSCLGNPGPGGYGAILDYKGHRRELSEGFRHTTNNRMELLAAIQGLDALNEPCDVTLYSDSQYLTKSMREGWPEKWRKKGWRRRRNGEAINPDLWETLLKLCETHSVEFRWIKGHAGHPENERCDQLAVAAAGGSKLAIDARYEQKSAFSGEPSGDIVQ